MLGWCGNRVFFLIIDLKVSLIFCVFILCENHVFYIFYLLHLKCH